MPWGEAPLKVRRKTAGLMGMGGGSTSCSLGCSLGCSPGWYCRRPANELCVWVQALRLFSFGSDFTPPAPPPAIGQPRGAAAEEAEEAEDGEEDGEAAAEEEEAGGIAEEEAGAVAEEAPPAWEPLQVVLTLTLTPTLTLTLTPTLTLTLTAAGGGRSARWRRPACGRGASGDHACSRRGGRRTQSPDARHHLAFGPVRLAPPGRLAGPRWVPGGAPYYPINPRRASAARVPRRVASVAPWLYGLVLPSAHRPPPSSVR